MSDCYTHNPYVPYMPDMIHVDSCPHTAVDNNTMLSVWCALGSLAVLIASVILCATRDTLTSHYAILLCSRFPSRDLYGFHPYHRRGKKPRSRTADQIRPVWFHRSLYSRSVPILGITLQDTQDVSRWLWLSLPLHRYGVSRHRASLPSVSSQFSATRQGILQVCRCSVSHVTLYGLC